MPQFWAHQPADQMAGRGTLAPSAPLMGSAVGQRVAPVGAMILVRSCCRRDITEPTV